MIAAFSIVRKIGVPGQPVNALTVRALSFDDADLVNG